jgi:hypothetical protein
VNNYAELLNKITLISHFIQEAAAAGWELKNGFFRTGRKGKNTKV